MKDTLKHLINQCMDNYSDDYFIEWLQRHPGQVVLCASQIIWTTKTQYYLQNQKLPLLDASLSLLNVSTSLVPWRIGQYFV